MKISENYIIRDYKKGDEEGITTLFKNVFEKVMTIEQWRWKYLLTGYRVYSKVVEDPSGEIIGHAGAIPLRGVFQKKLIQFFQIADVMVYAKARGHLGRKGVFEKLCKDLYADIGKEYSKVFCYGFPSARHFKLGSIIGLYEAVEQRAIDNIKQPGRSLFNAYTIKEISWDDNRLDSLWSELSSNFSLSIIRDKSYLHWRYATNPFFSYQLFGVFLLGRFKGWVILRDSGDEVLIVDFLFENRRLKSVFTAIENFLASKKTRRVRFWLPEAWRKTINNYTQKKTEAVVTNVVWELPMPTDIVKKNYFYTMGDVDIF
jgi:hypothetical protein